MEKEPQIIICPSCGEPIDVNQVLIEQVSHELEAEFQKKSARKEQELKLLQAKVDEDKKRLELERENIQNQIERELKSKLSVERTKIEQQLKNQLLEENQEQFLSLQKELREKSEQVKELNKSRAEIERLKREQLELSDKISYQKELELTQKLQEETQKIKQIESDKTALKIKELEKQLNDQKLLAEEMKRKAEQGSMQLQGEIQELAIEEILKVAFPYDTISEVGKGVRGADISQTVRNKLGIECGVILFESKRTKAFSSEWIAKLKADAVFVKADICVLVTETLPADIEKIGIKEGVWICSLQDFKGLVTVLRENIIKIHEAFSSQVNKGEKMQMLYDYLISNEFALQIGAIMDGFRSLQDNYHKEKQQMQRLWKDREKQLDKVLLNTNHFIGTIKGIAGSSIESIKLLDKEGDFLDSE